MKKFFSYKKLKILISFTLTVCMLVSSFLIADGKSIQTADSNVTSTDSSESQKSDTSIPENSDSNSSDLSSSEDQYTDQVYQGAEVTASASSSTRLTKKFTCKNKGYQLMVPSDAVIATEGTGFDARITTGEYTLEISKEWSPYSEAASDLAEGLSLYVPDFKWSDGKDQYIGYYESRFLLNQTWQQNNRVSVSAVKSLTAGGYTGIYYSAVISDVPDNIPDGYTYLYLRMNDQWFLRVVAKYQSSGTDPSSNTAQETQLKKILSSITTFTPSGSSVSPQKYHPERTAAWSDETQAFYDRLKSINTDDSSEKLQWGITTQYMPTTGIDETVPNLEKQLDYSFDALLIYRHFYEGFPTEFMNKAYNQGKYVELTFQITDNNNSDLYARSLFLQLYRQDPDAIEVIRQFARDAKAFGHPFLFRPCNEMNSDWVSYGGVVNMADPDIYIENWRTIYKIFEEEGVDNCIWVFNPNDRNAPPDDWNGALNYYPGNEYVDVIGVTGYNNGTYYSQWLEQWREFEDIYDQIQNEYGEVFGDFPWIITEFSSSSIGGDKSSWIRSMFKTIGKYKNIKLAVWFDCADYDSEGNVSRPYWLDETPDTLRAFKNGLTGAPYFEDLKGSEWAYDAIYEVTDAGYFKGTSETTFDPSQSVSRAMIFTVIARMAGVDTTTDGEWYLPGLNWAVENKVSDGTNPSASITREQLVTMLYRWVQDQNSSDPDDSVVTDPDTAESQTNDTSDSSLLSGSDPTDSVDSQTSAGSESNAAENSSDDDIFLNYPDADLMSFWAVDAMKWALEQGIIKGNDLGLLDPQGTATRAQTAIIIQRITALLAQ